MHLKLFDEALPDGRLNQARVVLHGLPTVSLRYATAGRPERRYHWPAPPNHTFACPRTAKSV
ncbi:hypothetical protein GCM10023081_22000 [Arthrobacter ginkgonis]|uniref:Uncharacterized protein n=1 Tax=Arthrobacter ginkgonis TaxID=1630594 RepID=A0ABP7C8W2_9MICC